MRIVSLVCGLAFCLFFLGCELSTVPASPGFSSGESGEVQLPPGHVFENDPSIGRILESVVIHGEALPGEIDTFILVDVSGLVVELRVETFGANFPGECDVDTRVEIHDNNSGEALLAEDDDSGQGFCSLLVMPITEGDALFLRVEGNGPYILSIEME